MLHYFEIQHGSETGLIAGVVVAPEGGHCTLRQLPDEGEDNKAHRRHQWNCHHIGEIPANQSAFHLPLYPNFKVTDLWPIAALKSLAIVEGFGAGRKMKV